MTKEPLMLLVLFVLFDQLIFTTCSVKLIAGGADAAGPVYTRWWQLFKLDGDTLNIEYKFLGSSGGKAWIKQQYSPLKGLTPVFVGSDTPMAQEDYNRFPELKIFPIIGDAVAIVFNIPNITQLTLDRNDIANIFLGRIKYWDDQHIQMHNSFKNLPHRRIKPVLRREGAGTTEVFTTALSAFSQDWKNGPGIFYKPDLEDGINGAGPSRNWPDYDSNSYFAWRTNGVAALVKAIPYTIGVLGWHAARYFPGHKLHRNRFLGVGTAYEWQMSIVTLINGRNTHIQPSEITAGAKEAMNYFAVSMNSKRLTANIVNAPRDHV